MDGTTKNTFDLFEDLKKELANKDRFLDELREMSIKNESELMQVYGLRDDDTVNDVAEYHDGGYDDDDDDDDDGNDDENHV